jgi:HD-GYP domain-containing protein (c-di-GMP phosphodiesterase class II)
MVAMPEALLDAHGPLGEDAWGLVRTHPLVGQRIVAAAPELADAARIVRSTHESWDGTGYPDGLAGHDIPLAARVIAACEAYAAMTSARPHRDPATPDEALAELRRCAGTQFDPRVVERLREALGEARDEAGDGTRLAASA